MIKILTTLKNGFGNQLDHLAYALHLYQKTQSTLYILKGFEHIHKNGYTYTTILPEYLNINSGVFDSLEKTPELNCISFISHDYIKRENILKNIHELNLICTDYPNILYTMYPKYFKDFNTTKKLMVLASHCTLRDSINDILSEDTRDRIGVYLRFFPTNLNYLKNKHLENNIKIPFTPISHLSNTLNVLMGIKNEKLFVVSDCYYLFKYYKIDDYIDSSNDVIFDIENISTDVDICDAQDTIKEYNVLQYNSFKLACRLATCKKFYGSDYSSFSEIFVPFLRIKLT